MSDNTEYSIFFEFIKNYSGSGFTGILNQDHFMIRLNRILDKGRQFFYIADLIKLKILYTSPQVLDLIGVEPENFDLSYNFKFTHPLDIKRRSRIRAKVIETGQEIFISKSGIKFFSSNFSMKIISGEYTNILSQCYLFYCSYPVETVYSLLVSTPIDWSLKTFKKGHYHWYSGDDLKYFRYPDEELLLTGSNLSERELNVLSYAHTGMSSKEIASKLSLSLYTINTHRRNILKKTQKTSIGEVIYELEEIGMI